MVKRGLFFWVELMFLLIIITVALISLPKSREDYASVKSTADLENLGYQTLRTLDSAGTLANFMDVSDFSNSNFTALEIYIKNSFSVPVESNLEYFNGTHCFASNGAATSGACNATVLQNMILSEYTYAKLNSPITIRLYLRSVFA